MSKYKVDIAEFPDEVVEWMLAQQEAQGNPRDVSVFEKDRIAYCAVGGFNWDEAVVPMECSRFPDEFCQKVIYGREFELFLVHFPQKWEIVPEIKIEALPQPKNEVVQFSELDRMRFEAACAAMTGILSNPHYSVRTTEDEFAAAAVTQADALIEALMKGKEQ
jgi:hypothetical protein